MSDLKEVRGDSDIEMEIVEYWVRRGGGYSQPRFALTISCSATYFYEREAAAGRIRPRGGCWNDYPPYVPKG